MDRRTDCRSICILLIHFVLALTSSTHCDAVRSIKMLRGPREAISGRIRYTKKWKLTKHFNLASLVLQKETMDPSNTNVNPYVSSPFSLPPYDSLPPMPIPENNPPFCIYPPNTPQTPSTTIPTPIGYTPSQPPPSSSYLPPVLPVPGPPSGSAGEVPSPPESIPAPNPPEIVPSPFVYTPSPPEIVPGPPTFNPSPPEVVYSPPSIIYSPPYYEPNPPSYVPSPPPTGFVPSPTVFHPPVVYPAPVVPPPSNVHPAAALWCVVKPSVPEPIIQEAMNYACGSGADCDSIQSSGACYEPNTVYAHASYAFNSYWQRTKVAGGTCSFGGTAILVTVDPSHDDCHFIYI